MLLMKSFRSVFDESLPAPGERFRVDVIGYRLRMSLPVDVPETKSGETNEKGLADEWEGRK